MNNKAYNQIINIWFILYRTIVYYKSLSTNESLNLLSSKNVKTIGS